MILSGLCLNYFFTDCWNFYSSDLSYDCLQTLPSSHGSARSFHRVNLQWNSWNSAARLLLCSFSLLSNWDCYRKFILGSLYHMTQEMSLHQTQDIFVLQMKTQVVFFFFLFPKCSFLCTKFCRYFQAQSQMQGFFLKAYLWWVWSWKI